MKTKLKYILQSLRNKKCAAVCGDDDKQEVKQNWQHNENQNRFLSSTFIDKESKSL